MLFKAYLIHSFMTAAKGTAIIKPVTPKTFPPIVNANKTYTAVSYTHLFYVFNLLYFR